MSVPIALPGLPKRSGVGLKPEHYESILDTWPDLGFFEVHAENYMGAGGPPHRYLNTIREAFPLSLHGVGLSIGGNCPLDREHLGRLKALIERYEPAQFSEHLAWSTHNGDFLNDLLPLPYTSETLTRVCEHVDEVQDFLGHQMLLENPSTYVAFIESTFEETDFIREIALRTGCGLLLDVNNVFVASTNQLWDPVAYVERFPLDLVHEIHLGGFTPEEDEQGRPLLIDTHDRPVDLKVWNLYRKVIGLIGPLPTLIEWDSKLPAWPDLLAEAHRVDRVLTDSNKDRALRDYA